MINGLKAVHTSQKLIDHVRSIGGSVRRNPVTSVHPIVRVHPITGERSLWVNPEFVTGIMGFKEEESDLMLKWLVDHVIRGHDFQARIQWERYSVVMFDGRSTLRKLLTSRRVSRVLSREQTLQQLTMTVVSRRGIYYDSHP